MSERYPGGIITKTPVTPTGPYQNGTAPGVWTLDQQLQFQQQGIWPTAGLVPNYIEDVFSTYLYTGTGATQSIVNGVNLSANGGLTWCKGRSNAYDNYLFDTVRGANNYIISDYTGAQNAFGTYSNLLTSFNSNGFSLGSDSLGSINVNAVTYASWTFRKQAKFFDVVTYNGTGSSPMAVNHNLGCQPGCVMIKRLNATSDWQVMFPGLISDGYGGTGRMYLNTTAAYAATGWTSVANATQITIPTNLPAINESGGTYVAYLFASNAGGFGNAGTDNVITCGSYTCVTYPGDVAVTLGYEPQWVMVKNATQSSNWVIYDNMRGMPATSPPNPVTLAPDSSAAENGVTGSAPGISPTATGFIARAGLTAVSGSSGDKVIYIAIRRGPMATPTDATKVFQPIAKTGDGSTTTVTNVGFPADLFMFKWRSLAYGWKQQDRLRGFPQQLASNATSQESNSGTYTFGTVNNTGYTYGADASSGANELNYSGTTSAVLAFGRAPGFFDEVCYTGTGSATTQTHNLGVAPELMIVKSRSAAGSNWAVYSSSLGATDVVFLNLTDATSAISNIWNNTTPTSSVFSIGTAGGVNQSGTTFVAYLFATVAGVSKVGSYTGNGTTQTINCGFGAGGVRFVLIKRTDSTGGWYVYDTARGMTTLIDPYLFMNSTSAETATLGSVTTVSTGFALNSSILAAINVSGGSYIFLAIA